ncbi:MAG: hypothetical protein F4018_09470 [Acidobacteria bacterium]|nr:hypothetical protein [Acidobacteriota bacterium]MYH30617.1 hypothetical protein [Acidobacteriota bacterium]MYK88544.1 hypothetical protein [Acidobacteriota bacterium]
MAQQTGWDWKKILLVVMGAAGVLVFALVGLTAVGFVWATSTVEQLGDPVLEPVASSVASRHAGEQAAGEGSPGQPLRVEIELEEGEFEVRPGPPGAGVQVDGSYAKGYYELIEDHTPAGEPGGPATTIRLRPAHPFFVRLFAGAIGGYDNVHNALTVTIPPDVPIALTLRLRAGESRTDLGGLTLTELDAELVMGEHRLDFSEPLEGVPSRVHVEGGMGEIRVERLGNARAREIEMSGRMGSMIADLGGDWPRGQAADLTIENTMGEFRLNVPNTVRIAPDSNAANVLGAVSRFPTEAEASAEAPLLRLHMSNSMGETRVRRY